MEMHSRDTNCGPVWAFNGVETTFPHMYTTLQDDHDCLTERHHLHGTIIGDSLLTSSLLQILMQDIIELLVPEMYNDIHHTGFSSWQPAYV